MFKSFIKLTPFGISLIVLFTAVLFLAAIVPVFGNKTLIVRTGSMSPAIGVGDLIFVFPKQNYQVGDIIAFNEGGKSQTTITHRITSIKQENGQISYQTKGDANKLADGTLVPKGNVLGSADYSIKGIGRVFAMVKTKNGFLLTAIFPAALVIILELVNIIREFKKPKVRYAPPVVPKPDFWSEPTPLVIPRSDIQPTTTPVIPTTPKGLSLKRIILFYNSKIPNPPKTLHHPMGLHFQSASFKSLFAQLYERLNFKSLKPSVGLPYYATSFKALLPYAIVVAIFTGSTLATTYSDSEESAGNVFRAAASYPSSSPNPSPSPGASPSPSPSPTPLPVTDHLVINEVVFDPPNTNACGSENDAEWLEIYNPTISAVNLDTWSVGDTLFTDDLPNVSLPAGGFAIVSDCTQASFNTIWPLPAGTIYIDIASAIGNALNNGGEQIRLLNGTTLIDAVSYGTNTDAFSPSVTAPVADHSIERDPDGVDTNTAADFVDRTTPTPGS